jgi:tetratricopeptide (TPR) repeat protein
MKVGHACIALFGGTLLSACGGVGAAGGSGSVDVQSLLNDAQTAAASGRADACIADYSKAVAAQPTLVKAYVGRGGCYTQVGNGPAAIHDYDQAIQLSPSDPDLLLKRGAAYESVGNNSSAAADFKKIGQLSSANPDQMLAAAQGLGGMNFTGDALALASQGVHTYPGSWRLHLYRAEVEASLGEDQQALKEFDATTHLTAGSDLAWVLGDRANFYIQRQSYSLAIVDLNRAIQLSPDFSYFESRGRAMLATGDLSRAETDFSSAIRRYPAQGGADKGTMVRLLEERGKVYSQEGQKEKAIADFKQALALVPTSDTSDRTRLTTEINSAGG